MKNLNLVDLDKSDIKYFVQNFPDGQVNLVLNPRDLKGYFDTDGETEYWTKKKSAKVQIISRLNNMEDMGIIICAVACLRRLGVKEIHLLVPYLLGARSDRQFEEGGNSYLVDVIAPLINAQNFESVTVLDVHNPDVTAACIKNLVVNSNTRLVTFAMNDLYGKFSTLKRLETRYVLVSPDAGASKKIQKVADAIGYRGEIITCSKVRDTDGKLTKTVVPVTHDHNDKDFIIIDDICDGGATFINIAKVIKNNMSFKGKLYLIVTHGIFSKGYSELGEYFDGIYCTNSYKNIGETEYHALANIPTKVKQLNIF